MPDDLPEWKTADRISDRIVDIINDEIRQPGFSPSANLCRSNAGDDSLPSNRRRTRTALSHGACRDGDPRVPAVDDQRKRKKRKLI
jgi:hypothetical protein